MLRYLDWYQVNSYQSPAHTVCPMQLQPHCTNKLTQWVTFLLHPIGTVWQPILPCLTQLELSNNQKTPIPQWGYITSIESPHTISTWWIGWSPESAQTVHPPVTQWILWIPATMQCALHFIPTIPLYVTSYVHFPIHSLVISFCWLVRPNRILLVQMAFSPPNSDSLIQSAANCENWKQSFRILSVGHFRPFDGRLITLPTHTCQTMCDCCASILNIACW